MDIDKHWNNKEKRAEIAKNHTQEFAKKYIHEIAQCGIDTVMYNTDFIYKRILTGNPSVILSDYDSVSAIFRFTQANKKIAVLNFASYKEPGGKFMEGSSAQEECLCHASFLYNVLREKHAYYDWNNRHKNRSMYMNRALYSPNVIFELAGDAIECDVITCAAPNYSAATKYQQISKKDNNTILKNRIKFVLDIAEANDVKTLILGAYGCGVFGQDPAVVSEIFINGIKGRSFDKVVFAIPDETGDNYRAFAKTIKSDRRE